MSLIDWLDSITLQAARTLAARRRGTDRRLGRVSRPALNVAERLESRVFLSAAPVFFHSQQTFATGTDPQSVAVADFNEDGKPDLAVANFADKTVAVMLGNGNGTFLPQQTFATGNGPNGLIAADLNHDALLDLIVANRNDDSVSVLLGTGGDNFAAQQTFATGSNPRSVTVADFNEDGRPDLAVANFISNSVSFLLGNGNGSFQTQQTTAVFSDPSSLAVADFNGDGVPDVVAVSFNTAALSVIPGNGNNTFPMFGVATNLSTPAAGVAVTDFNGDGKPDLVVANYSNNSVGVLLGTGNIVFNPEQTFSTGAGSLPDVVAAADLNGDGKPDIIVNTSGNTMGTLLGNGNGSFAAQQTLATGLFPAAFAVADVNSDGSPDLVVPNFGEGNVGVLLNDPPPVLVSIARANPTVASTQAFSIAFTVTFSEPVTGVSSGTFFVTNDASITIDPLIVSPSAGPASVYTVSINDIAGNGNVQLHAFNLGGIVNDAGEGLRDFVSFATHPFLGPGAQDIAVADVNGDGKPDVISADLINNDIAVLLSNGDGTVQPGQTFSTGANSHPLAVVVGDLNVDGKLDLVSADEGTDCVSVLLGNGNGTFQPQQTFSTGTGSAPRSLQLADFNVDGKLDLVVADSGTNSVSWLQGSGTGTFGIQQTAAVGKDPLSIAVADINGDGRPDLVTANFSDQTVSVLLHTPPSSGIPFGAPFKPQQTFAAGGVDDRVLMADLNGDGKDDLIVCNPSSGNIAVLAGNGDGTFTTPQTFAASGFDSLSIADMNGDGHPDLVGIHFYGSIAQLLGNGDGTFQDQQTFSIGTTASVLTTADINDDGHPDLVVANRPIHTVGVVLNQLDSVEFDGPSYTILLRDAILTVTGAEVLFDGNSHAATVTAVGTKGEDLSTFAALTYTNLADNTSSSTPPTQPGTYEVFATFTGNTSYNAIASFDTGRAIVIDRLSPFQSVPSGHLPTATLVAGQKITPIHLNIKLTNNGLTAVPGDVSVDVTLSSSPSGTPTDFIFTPIKKAQHIKPHKTAPFGVVTIRSLPDGITGMLNILVKLTDASGARNVISAGTIVVAAPFTDLAAVSVVAPPRARLGKKLTATLTIQSRGNFPFDNSVPVELFLSTTAPTLDPGAIDLGLTGGHLVVRPNRKGVLHLTRMIPSSVSPGTYFVFAKLDPNNTLGDTNASNNMISSIRKVTVS